MALPPRRSGVRLALQTTFRHNPLYGQTLQFPRCVPRCFASREAADSRHAPREGSCHRRDCAEFPPQRHHSFRTSAGAARGSLKIATAAGTASIGWRRTGFVNSTGGSASTAAFFPVRAADLDRPAFRTALFDQLRSGMPASSTAIKRIMTKSRSCTRAAAGLRFPGSLICRGFCRDFCGGICRDATPAGG